MCRKKKIIDPAFKEIIKPSFKKCSRIILLQNSILFFFQRTDACISKCKGHLDGSLWGVVVSLLCQEPHAPRHCVQQLDHKSSVEGNLHV